MSAGSEGLDRSSFHRQIPVRFVGAASVLLLALLFGFVACNHSSISAVSDVSAQDILSMSEKADGPVLVDVRTPTEYASGHVPRAINIPVGEVTERLTELASHKKEGVVLYCEQGGRALKAATILVSAGFPNVGHLKGDMSGWRAAGLPIER
ncbi:MAG TPA: rhodanese-like domain-containing protein [Myxococcota bacterium]|nr:rhodanese-like domain-containing protein [Myxococcota bacterium]